MQIIMLDRRWVHGAVFAGAVMLIAAGHAKAKVPPESLAYDGDTGRLSAAIEPMLAGDLLHAIADAASIHVRSDVGTVRAQAFDELLLTGRTTAPLSIAKGYWALMLVENLPAILAADCGIASSSGFPTGERPRAG